MAPKAIMIGHYTTGLRWEIARAHSSRLLFADWYTMLFFAGLSPCS